MTQFLCFAGTGTGKTVSLLFKCYKKFPVKPGAIARSVAIFGGSTGLVVRASDSGSGDPGSILGRVGVLFP